jgi:hypothetical protein
METGESGRREMANKRQYLLCNLIGYEVLYGFNTQAPFEMSISTAPFTTSKNFVLLIKKCLAESN